MKKILFICISLLLIVGCKKVIVKVAPTVSTTTTTYTITATTATINGSITDDGGDPITARGVVYGLSPNPTISDGKTSDGTGIGTYTSIVSGLLPGKTYYFRTYATNSTGTSYGEQLTLTTQAVLSTVTTTAASAITSTTATSGGNITADGGSAITARGVCWGTTANPTTSGSKTTDGTGIGSFTSAITGLTPGASYYARAYATNAIGTSYGDQITIAATAITATVATTAASAITATTATSGGSISSDGGSAVTAKGVCWSTSQTPTVALTTKTSDGTGTATFTSAITGLSPNTTYYVRAYATNSIGTAYGTQITITTATALPTVTTSSISGITSSAASGGGNVTLDGGAAVTARGVCWSTSAGPTIALTTKTSDGTGTGSFTSSITGLSPATTYYIRAYATNSAGTAYGTELTFTTLANLPTVTTATLTNITSISATGGGVVTSDGGATVTARGVCWGTSQTPTISDSKLLLGTGVGTFSGSITGLTAGVVYYVRAFATNSAGTAYGIAMSVNGLTADINNIISQAYIDELIRLGMPINGGVTPPNVMFVFNVTPNALKGTNIPNDWAIGTLFWDERIQFSLQDNSKLTVKVDYIQGTTEYTSIGSYIVGSGNNFTIFCKTVSKGTNGNDVILVEIYSGTVDTNSVKNFYSGLIMVDNGGNTDKITNGQGRVFWDNDGVSEKVTSLKSAHIPIGSIARDAR
jgi:hypothetical protein